MPCSAESCGLQFCTLLNLAEISRITYMNTQPNRSMLMAAVLFFVASVVSAIPYKVGDYTVDVEVRNMAMNLIVNAKVDCWLNGDRSITVKARAIGYQDAKRQVTIYPQQNFYKTDLTLLDVDHRVRIIDMNEQVISSAYARTDQYGVPGDQFGVTVFIPIEVWKRPIEKNVDIIEPFFGLPFKKTCEITQVDEFHQVRIQINRKALEWSEGDLVVMFNTRVPANPQILKKRLARIELLPNTPAGEQARVQICELIAESCSPEDLAALDQPLPESLEKLVAAARRFSELHREKF